MLQLLLGLLLFVGIHLWKRVAPASRARWGDRGKLVVTVVSILGIVLMARGYGAWAATSPIWWGRTPAMTGINNLLVLVAVYLFAASGMKTRITRVVRHPQLTAVVIWAVAHLLVNGDLRSVVLFGGLGIWALAEMALVSRAEPLWPKPAPAPVAKEVTAVVAAVVAYAVIGLVHGWIGPWPFGG